MRQRRRLARVRPRQLCVRLLEWFGELLERREVVPQPQVFPLEGNRRDFS